MGTRGTGGEVGRPTHDAAEEMSRPLSTTTGAFFLTERQLAQRWGVSVKTLQANRLKGSPPPFVKIGAAVRYAIADIAAYELERRRNSTSDAG